MAERFQYFKITLKLVDNPINSNERVFIAKLSTFNSYMLNILYGSNSALYLIISWGDVNIIKLYEAEGSSSKYIIEVSSNELYIKNVSDGNINPHIGIIGVCI